MRVPHRSQLLFPHNSRCPMKLSRGSLIQRTAPIPLPVVKYQGCHHKKAPHDALIVSSSSVCIDQNIAYGSQYVARRDVVLDGAAIDGPLAQNIHDPHQLFEQIGELRFHVNAGSIERFEEVPLLGGLSSELVKECEERLTRVRVVLEVACRVDETGQSRHDDGFVEGFLRREVSIQGSDADTRTFGDGVNGHQHAFEREGLFGGDEKQVYIKISTVSGDIRIDKAS